MKTDAMRINRAADDIAAKLGKSISDLRPAIQAQHKLSEYMLELAITKAAELVAAGCAECCSGG